MRRAGCRDRCGHFTYPPVRRHSIPVGAQRRACLSGHKQIPTPASLPSLLFLFHLSLFLPFHIPPTTPRRPLRSSIWIMPPSPGRIHSLPSESSRPASTHRPRAAQFQVWRVADFSLPPVKVLYSLDNSSQSYLTTLNDRHDVYVHPATPLSGEDSSGGLGSCYLKGVAWGVCFARYVKEALASP